MTKHPSQLPSLPHHWTSIAIYCLASRANCTLCVKGKLGYNIHKQDDYKCMIPQEVLRALKTFGAPQNAPKDTIKAAVKLLQEARLLKRKVNYEQ